MNIFIVNFLSFVCVLLLIGTTSSMAESLSHQEIVVAKKLLQPSINERILKLLNNKNLILAAVRHNGMALEYAHPDLKKDKEVVLVAIKQNGMALQFANSSLRKNKEIVLSAIRSKGKAFVFASPALKNNKQFILNAIHSNDTVFKYIGRAFQADKKIIMTAINKNPRALRFSSLSLKDEKSLIFSQVKKNPNNCSSLFYNASKRLKIDKDFVLHLIIKEGCILTFSELGKNLQQEREIALEGVKQGGWNLNYVGTLLKDDKEIVRAAVNKNGSALQYASSRLKKDRDIVFAAIKNSPYILDYISPSLKKDRDFWLQTAKKHKLKNAYIYAEATVSDRSRVLKAVKKLGKSLEYVRNEFKNDKEIVLAAIQQSVSAFKFANKKLQQDKQVIALLKKAYSKDHFSKKMTRSEMLTKIKNSHGNIYLEQRFLDDKEIVLATISSTNNFSNYFFNQISSGLKHDKIIIQAFINKAITMKKITHNYNDRYNLLKYFHYLSNPIKNKTHLLHILKKEGLALQYADTLFKKDRDVVLTAISQNGEALAYADAHFKYDKSIVLAAIKKSAKAFYFANKSLKANEEVVFAAIKGKNTLFFLYNALDNKYKKLITHPHQWKKDNGFYQIKKHHLKLAGLSDFYKEDYYYFSAPHVIFNKDRTKMVALLRVRPTNQGQLAVWSTKTGRLLYSTLIPEFSGVVTGLRFTPNSRRLVLVFSGHTTYIWNFFQNKKPISCNMDKTSPSSGIADINNQSVLLIPSDGMVGLYDLDNCNIIAIQRDMSAPRAIISPDNKILMVIPKGSLSEDKKNFYLYRPTYLPASFLSDRGHTSLDNYRGKVIIKEINFTKK